MDPAILRNLRTVPVSPLLSLFSTRFCRNSPRFSPQSPKNGVHYKFLFKLMFHRRFWLFGKENKTCPLHLALVGSQIQTKPSCVMSSNQITKPNCSRILGILCPLSFTNSNADKPMEKSVDIGLFFFFIHILISYRLIKI